MALMKVNESFLHAAEAAADLTTSLHHLVKIDDNGNVALCGADQKAFGVLFEVPLSATTPFGPATVQFAGIAKVKASAAIQAGMRVASAAGGKAKAGTTNPVGIALDTVTADLQIVTVALIG